MKNHVFKNGFLKGVFSGIYLKKHYLQKLRIKSSHYLMTV